MLQQGWAGSSTRVRARGVGWLRGGSYGGYGGYARQGARTWMHGERHNGMLQGEGRGKERENENENENESERKGMEMETGWGKDREGERGKRDDDGTLRDRARDRCCSVRSW